MSVLTVAALLLPGCYKVPTTYVNDDVLVVTLHDMAGDFKQLATFAISDTIGMVSDDNSDKPIYTSDSKNVVNNIASNFTSRGFKRVNKNQVPDFAVNVTAIKVLNVTTYYPGYYYGYGGYYGGSYWGYPGYSYYYPWAYTYTYATGSLFIEVIDLKHKNVQANKLNVIWFCLLNGYLDSGGNSATVNTYVNKGFKQSPYIQAN
ncbi:MAG: DUF4136 domain-containing protein [bacterium]|nr:DUF4136 domain-containing protein [bacterium]